MTMHKINELKLSGPGDGRLYLRFDEDEWPEFHDMVDLSATLAQGGVLRRCAIPAVFARVQIGPRGRTLIWRIDDDVVDLCADALWLMAHPEERSAAAE